jgi:hypothetical protein
LIGWDGRPDTGGASVAALDITHLSEADPRVRVTGMGLGGSFTAAGGNDRDRISQADRMGRSVWNVCVVVGCSTR